jgi:hypothetical protein
VDIIEHLLEDVALPYTPELAATSANVAAGSSADTAADPTSSNGGSSGDVRDSSSSSGGDGSGSNGVLDDPHHSLKVQIMRAYFILVFAGLVWCTVFDGKLHSMMPLDPTPARFKRTGV